MDVKVYEKDQLKNSKQMGKKEVRLELMISACYFLSFRKNQVFSKSGRSHLSVRFCALNKPPLMRELPLQNLGVAV